MANYKDNSNKNLEVDSNGIHLRMHVFEPEESVNHDDWYKDMTTFDNMQLRDVWRNISVGDIVEDSTGARFKIISRHWKWDKDENGRPYSVLEFTSERYMRRGKQNPYML